MVGLDDRVLRDILERAVGPDRASTAFDAFSQPPSVSIRFNPFKINCDLDNPTGSGQPSGPGRVHPRFAAAEYGLSPAAAPEVSGFPALAAVADEDNATLGTRGGTGAERSEASGGAERSEASELPFPSNRGSTFSAE